MKDPAVECLLALPPIPCLPDNDLMGVKQSPLLELSEQQRLERLTQLCEELQAAVDRAGDQRRLLEEVKQVAQELLTDAESTPRKKKKSHPTG